jgi:hypothetical protein
MYHIMLISQIFETIHEEVNPRFNTLPLILIAIFANILLYFVKTIDFRQHCDMTPISVSQIFLIFPVVRSNIRRDIYVTEVKKLCILWQTLPYKLPLLSGSIARSRSIFWSLSSFCASW